MRPTIAIAFLLVARAASADDCELAYAKTHAVFEQFGGRPSDRVSEVARCRAASAKRPWEARLAHCFATLPGASADAIAIYTCMESLGDWEEQGSAWLHVLAAR